MEKKFSGNRRIYKDRINSLDVEVHISTNTNPQLAKILGYDPKKTYMFADVYMTDKDGLCELCKPYNKNEIIEVLGLRETRAGFSFEKLEAFDSEVDIDKYAERIMKVV